MLQAQASQDDRIRNDVAERQRRAKAKEPLRLRRPVEHQRAVADSAECLIAVMDVAVWWNVRIAGQG